MDAGAASSLKGWTEHPLVSSPVVQGCPHQSYEHPELGSLPSRTESLLYSGPSLAWCGHP